MKALGNVARPRIDRELRCEYQLALVRGQPELANDINDMIVVLGWLP
jgi:hypothetical protein